jgi:Rrf2 family transcriptional regulator, nitric oxide-sensitive transcriptional repressor
VVFQIPLINISHAALLVKKKIKKQNGIECPMRLAERTDFGLRILLYLATMPERNIPVDEIARAFGISENHLMKVAQSLTRAGFTNATRGRGGGIRLSLPPAQISVGMVVRVLEPDFHIADCAVCVIAPACHLQHLLDQAAHLFLTELDKSTLQDLVDHGRSATLIPLLLSKPRAALPPK